MVAWLILGAVLLTVTFLGLLLVRFFQPVTVLCYRPDVARQQVTAARHAALPPVQVVRTTIVNERKALP